MTMDGIYIRNLHKVFGEIVALNEINLHIPSGKIIALAGPDGSGKTTLIRLIAGLLLPTKGEIKVRGYDTAKEADKIHESIGYMPQKFGVYEDLTILQNLNLYADLKGVIGEEKKTTIQKLLTFTNLAPFLNRLSKDLSGGMKQKLGLACALLSKPKLLLLDEPTVGVDPISRRELWKMVQELLLDGITVLWSTAYLDEAQQCDLVVLLNEGGVLYYGLPDVITQRVANRVFHVRNFINTPRQALSNLLNRKDVIDGVIQGDALRIVLKEEKPFKIEEDAGCSITKTEPRFEDGFMDILGGGPGGTSLLALKSSKIESNHHIMIEAKELTKCFGSFKAVNNINFQVKTGEVFGLLGPNGAGKSTTFKMLCGLLKPSKGETYVNGLDLYKAKGPAREHIGYMAQKFSLYEGLSLLQNLKIFSGLYDLNGKKQKDVLEEIIEVFNFRQFLEQTVLMLPLGFKQRLALACSVMHYPHILFLDEPTSGVDPITRRDFWNHINGLVEKGTTVMLTTHFIDEAENCDRVGLVYGGCLITVGTPHELKQKAISSQLLNPTLEDAFIYLIEQYDQSKKP